MSAVEGHAGTPVLIWGAGAMGGSIGAWLVDAGYSVLLVDQDVAHVDAINTRGLEITGPVRAFRVRTAACLPSGVKGTFPTVLLCVKAHHTAEAVTALTPHLAPDGCVVSIQNGLNEREIAKVVGASRTVGAFVNFGADLMEPGRVLRGNRGAVVLGELNGRVTARIRNLQTMLTAFEPDARVTDNIFGFLWSKLAYGALLFATATTHLSIADALEAEEHQPFLVELGREVSRVAQAANVRLESFDGFDPGAFQSEASDAAALASIADLVAFNRGSAKTHSGIWRDLAVRKRRTEANAQLGAIVAEGEARRVATPRTAAVLEMIVQIESGRRVQNDNNLCELGDRFDS